MWEEEILSKVDKNRNKILDFKMQYQELEEK
jgi:hypothetical protein